MTTKIEWTRNADGTEGETWNPVVGCEYASPGCLNCYAARQAATRLAHVPVYAGLATMVSGSPAKFTGEVRCLRERLDTPLRRKKPTTYFVNSMSDLFHPDVPVGFIGDVWATMGAATQHTFQILTKRPQRMDHVVGCMDWAPLPNVWLGTSIECDRYSFRADHLRATPAAVRFLSLEPLLGPLPSLDLTGIDWVIVGGESGPGARPMDLEWARDLMAQCRDAGVKPFVKQLGSCWSGRHHRDLKGGDIATFPADLQVREMPV